MASSVAVSQACSAVTTSMRSGSSATRVAFGDAEVEESMRAKPRRAASSRDFCTSSGRGFDAVDVAVVPAP
jgi:hypothetical protein